MNEGFKSLPSTARRLKASAASAKFPLTCCVFAIDHYRLATSSTGFDDRWTPGFCGPHGALSPPHHCSLWQLQFVFFDPRPLCWGTWFPPRCRLFVGRLPHLAVLSASPDYQRRWNILGRKKNVCACCAPGSKVVRLAPAPCRRLRHAYSGWWRFACGAPRRTTAPSKGRTCRALLAGDAGWVVCTNS